MEERERAFVPRNLKSPRVFGSNVFGMKKEETPPATSVATPAQSTIIVQTAAPTPSPSNELDVLADYVLGARNTIEREERDRVVTKIITASPSLEERKRIAAALDERIKAKKPPEEQKKSIWSLLR